MQLEKEAEFFHDIAARVRGLVLAYEGTAQVAKYKRAGDYATEVDVAVEELIVAEIKKLFPSDDILAEEAHAATTISDERIWIIDPICGTANLGRGMKTFCTNIALAEKGELIAACVVDHSQGDYIWSTGEGLYMNDRKFERPKREGRFGVMVDVDLGAVADLPEAQRKRCTDTILKLVLQQGVMLESLNSSLSFTYVALGKMDGFINVTNYPWDICAGSFLIQQSGGIITDLTGALWKITSVGAIAARDPATHKKLIDAYSGSI